MMYILVIIEVMCVFKMIIVLLYKMYGVIYFVVVLFSLIIIFVRERVVIIVSKFGRGYI